MLPADRGRGLVLMGAALLLALLRHDMAPSSAPALPSDSPRSPPVREEPAAPQPSPGSAPGVAQAPAPPEDVLWAGCHEVQLSASGHPRVCTFVDDGTPESVTLRVWLPSSVIEPVVSLDGTPIVAIDAAPVDDGWSLLVQPGHAGHLIIADRKAEPAPPLLSFALEFRPQANQDLRAELDAAVGKPKAQRALAQRWREQLRGETALPQRLLLTRYLHYVSFDLGDYRDSVSFAKEAVALAQALGEPLAECDSAWAAAYTLGDRLGDEPAALELLGQVCRHHDVLPSVAMIGGYYEGVLEHGQGRFTHARRSLQRSAQIARRLRWVRWEIFALDPLSDVLANQGRFGWARQVVERSRELDAVDRSTGLLDRCHAQTGYHHKLGELAYREAGLTGRDVGAARAHWLEARAVLRDRARCPDHPMVHARAVRVELDLARAALEAGELAEAERTLDAVSRATVIPFIDVGRRLLRAELELSRGHAEAAARLLQDLAAEDARGTLAEAFEPEQRWRLHLSWARVHAGRGDLPAALEALAQAQAQLDVDRGALGVERDRQAAMWRKSSELLVRLLLDHGLERQALCAARIARARGFVSLGPLPERARGTVQAMERARAALFEGYQWYDPRDIPLDERMKLEDGRRELETTLPTPPVPLACDQLPAAQPGEASLLYFEYGRGDDGRGTDGRGTVGFGWDSEGHVVVHRLSPWSGELRPAALGEALLTPFARVLEGASQLRVLAPATMHPVSFADLPWRGRPLGETLAVAYALDLPQVPLEGRREGTAALAFSDPHKRLMARHAELEAHFDQWRSRLRAHGLRVVFSRSPLSTEHASVGSILEHTRGVELALLYGFGAVAPSYYDPLRSSHEPHEPDQDGFGVGADVLTRADVLLAAGQVPERVILAHCDSATVDVHGVSGAIGLAQSHVQAGALWAVGAVGDVAPESMTSIVDVLLEALPRGASPAEAAAALELAKRRLRERGLEGAEQLRLWVR